jgi:hypothetical protein
MGVTADLRITANLRPIANTRVTVNASVGVNVHSIRDIGGPRDPTAGAAIEVLVTPSRNLAISKVITEPL